MIPGTSFARTGHGIWRDGHSREPAQRRCLGRTQVKCLELPLDTFADYRNLHPQIALQIMRNLSALLARRLILANAKVDLLSAY
jgi:CRP-like cAMP-binding protein